MNEFRGFPDGRLDYTPLPNLFFSELLPLVDDLAELKVTLYVFFLLYRKKGAHSYVSLAELRNDGTLLRSLQGLPVAAEAALLQGLEGAVRRGTLLHLQVPDEQVQELYCANSMQGRKTAEKAQLGEIKVLEGAELIEPARLVERSNIYSLYEQTVGLLQPIIAEELKEAEASYPPAWIEEAFQIAAARNVRNWHYVKRILERWETEGKDNSRDRTWYTEEESRKYIKR